MPDERDRYFNWLDAARRKGGGFVSTFADAVLRADPENFRILLPALELISEKYPEYGQMSENLASDSADLEDLRSVRRMLGHDVEGSERAFLSRLREIQATLRRSAELIAPEPAPCGLPGHRRDDRRRGERLNVVEDTNGYEDRRRADVGWCARCAFNDANAMYGYCAVKIKRLEAENQRLREALETAADRLIECGKGAWAGDARAALDGK